MNDFAKRTPMEARRWIVAALAMVGLSTWAFLRLAPESWSSMGGFGDQASRRFAAGMLGRLGLMMSALWLAWPSLRRPAAWLPPGAILLVIGAVALIALRPRLILPALPLLGVVITLGWAVRIFRP